MRNIHISPYEHLASFTEEGPIESERQVDSNVNVASMFRTLCIYKYLGIIRSKELDSQLREPYLNESRRGVSILPPTFCVTSSVEEESP